MCTFNFTTKVPGVRLAASLGGLCELCIEPPTLHRHPLLPVVVWDLGFVRGSREVRVLATDAPLAPLASFLGSRSRIEGLLWERILHVGYSAYLSEVRVVPKYAL